MNYSIVVDNSLVRSAVQCREPEEDFLVSGISLAMLLEALVLHDHIRILWPEEHFIGVGQRSTYPEIYLSPEDLRSDPLLAPLIEIGTITIETISQKRHFTEVSPIAGRLMDREERLERKTPGIRLSFDPVYAAESVWQLKQADRSEASYVPNARRESEFVLWLMNRQQQRAISLLEKAYATLSEELRGMLQRLRAAGRQCQVYIPPIPAIILSRATSYDSLGLVAREMHLELEATRRAFAQYELTIRDDSLPIGESLAALDRLESGLQQLAEDQPYRAQLQVSEWKDVGGLLSAGLDGLELKDAGSLTGFLLGQPVKLLGRSARRRQAAYLPTVKKDFFKIAGYGRLLQACFKTDIGTSHIAYAKDVLSDRLHGNLMG